MVVDKHGEGLLDCTREEERRDGNTAAVHVVNLASGSNNKVLAFTVQGKADVKTIDGLIQQCHKAAGHVHAAIRQTCVSSCKG